MSTADTVLLGGIITTILFIAFVAWLLLVIAHWKMFTKAGEKGWKALIPIYSDYTLYKLVWNTKSFWIFVVSTILTVYTSFFCGQYAISAGQLVYVGGGNMLISIVSFIASMAMLCYAVMCTINTAFAYGKGFGFALGLVLLPNIFALILAFGSAEYRGPQG